MSVRDHEILQRRRAESKIQRNHENNEFAGPDHETWTGWYRLPPILYADVANADDIIFRVGSHYRAEFQSRSSKRQIKSKELISNLSKLSPDAELCWNIILSGGATCPTTSQINNLAQKALRDFGASGKSVDLIPFARKLSIDYGLRLAAEILKVVIVEQSSDIDRAENVGELEKRLVNTTKKKATDSHFFYEDSWATMTANEKSKTVFFLVYGQSHNEKKSPAVKAMNGMRDYLNREGFDAFIATDRQGDSTWLNAIDLRRQIVSQADNYDRIVLVPISKGTQEVVHFTLDHLKTMDPISAKKIKLVVSLSGVVRYSYISKWLSVGFPAGPTRALLKSLVILKGGEERSNLLRGSLDSLAADPWASSTKSFQKPQQLKWVNFAMLPDRADGTQKYGNIQLIWNFILNANAAIGPQDGATETATSVLPPGTGFEQHIIRAYGPHNLIPGVFMDGTQIAPIFHDESVKDRESLGGEYFNGFNFAILSAVAVGTIEISLNL